MRNFAKIHCAIFRSDQIQKMTWALKFHDFPTLIVKIARIFIKREWVRLIIKQASQTLFLSTSTASRFVQQRIVGSGYDIAFSDPSLILGQ